LKPASDRKSVTALAACNAKQDAANGSIALRLDRYALNRARLGPLCIVKGDLQEIAVIVESGMPPQVKPGSVES
jgi:hypothetical protein